MLFSRSVDARFLEVDVVDLHSIKTDFLGISHTFWAISDDCRVMRASGSVGQAIFGNLDITIEYTAKNVSENVLCGDLIHNKIPFKPTSLDISSVNSTNAMHIFITKILTCSNG